MKFIQHATNNDVLGAPSGVNIEQCRALPITRVQYVDGTLGVISYWQPSDAEKTAIAEGKPIALTVLGVTHAPVIVGVDGIDQ